MFHYLLNDIGYRADLCCILQADIQAAPYLLTITVVSRYRSRLVNLTLYNKMSYDCVL